MVKVSNVLVSYLKGAGVITGPLSKHTSHSSLEIIKKCILGQDQFKGGEIFLIYGSALHERWLEDKATIKLKSPVDRQKISASIAALNSHPAAIKLLRGSTREEALKVMIEGVLVKFILDIHRKLERVGADLKTTGCRCLSEFIEKAKEYGYFRQGLTYMLAADLREFYFIGVTKTTSPKVFVFRLNDYPMEIKYAREELRFLLYFYQHYGNFIL